MAAALGDELDAHAEERAHAERGGAFEDQLQLAGHFHDENALEPHTYGGEAEVDELLVLVAVADEAGFRVCGVWDVSAEEDQAALKALADWYVRDLGDWVP